MRKLATKPSQPATSCSQDADALRAALDEQSELLIAITRRAAASTTQLAQVRAILADLLADAGIETTDDPVRLAVQVRALVRALEAALHKVLDEAHGDCDRAAILAAARGALVEDE